MSPVFVQWVPENVHVLREWILRRIRITEDHNVYILSYHPMYPIHTLHTDIQTKIEQKVLTQIRCIMASETDTWTYHNIALRLVPVRAMDHKSRNFTRLLQDVMRAQEF